MNNNFILYLLLFYPDYINVTGTGLYTHIPQLTTQKYLPTDNFSVVTSISNRF